MGVGGGEICFLPPAPEAKKKPHQYDLLPTSFSVLATIDIFTTIFLQALTCVRLTRTTRRC